MATSELAVESFLRVAHELGAADNFISQKAIGEVIFPPGDAFEQSINATVGECTARCLAETTVNGGFMLTAKGIEVAQS